MSTIYECNEVNDAEILIDNKCHRTQIIFWNLNINVIYLFIYLNKN